MGRAVNQGTALPTASIVELDTPELRAAFAREVADVNRRRLRVIGPLMVLVHAAHAWLFSVAVSDCSTLTEPMSQTMIEALHRFVIVHCAMLVITGFLTLLVLRSTSPRIARWMGPVVATLYLTHGALSTAIGLVSTQSVSTYVGYCLY